MEFKVGDVVYFVDIFNLKSKVPTNSGSLDFPIYAVDVVSHENEACVEINDNLHVPIPKFLPLDGEFLVIASSHEEVIKKTMKIAEKIFGKIAKTELKYNN